MNKIYEKIRQNYTEKAIDQACQIYSLLKVSNINIEDFCDFRQDSIRKSTQLYTKVSNKKYSLPCPLCGNELSVIQLDIQKGKANIYGYSTYVHCTSQLCFYEKFSTSSPTNWITNFLGGE